MLSKLNGYTFALLLVVTGVTSAAAQEIRSIEGVTEPYRNLLIKASSKRNPPWTSRIAQVNVVEGDVVEIGQALVELDRSTEELEAKLRKLIAEDQNDVKNARVKEATLLLVYERSKSVYEQTKSLSVEDLQQREISYLNALNERQRLEMSKQRDLVEAELALSSLEKQTIRSPIRGVVQEVFLHDGESCDPGDPLMRILDVSRGYLVANVEEKLGRTLKQGDTVDLRIQKGEGFGETTGTIVFVSSVVDPGSGLMPVKVEFSNADGELKPGVPGAIVFKGPAAR